MFLSVVVPEELELLLEELEEELEELLELELELLEELLLELSDLLLSEEDAEILVRPLCFSKFIPPRTYLSSSFDKFVVFNKIVPEIASI